MPAPTSMRPTAIAARLPHKPPSITRSTFFGAAQAGHEQAAKFLFDHGAKPDGFDTYGKSAEDYAYQNHHEAVVKLIEQARK